MTKISIKIRNHFGVNSFRGEDLDVESAKSLMDVATEMIKADRLSLSAPLPYMTTTYLGNDESEFEQGLYDTQTGVHHPITAPLTHVPRQLPTEHVRDAQPAPIMTQAEVAATEAPAKQDVDAGTIAHAMMEKIVENSANKKQAESDDSKTLLTGRTPVTTKAPVAIISMEERLAEMNKDYFTTGIKYKERHGEIIPHYRLRYNCPKCNEQGNHYVPENVKNVFCHSCNTALVPKQATKKFLSKDEWDNFFVANELNTKFLKA